MSALCNGPTITLWQLARIGMSLNVCIHLILVPRQSLLMCRRPLPASFTRNSPSSSLNFAVPSVASGSGESHDRRSRYTAPFRNVPLRSSRWNSTGSPSPTTNTLCTFVAINSSANSVDTRRSPLSTWSSSTTAPISMLCGLSHLSFNTRTSPTRASRSRALVAPITARPLDNTSAIAWPEVARTSDTSRAMVAKGTTHPPATVAPAPLLRRVPSARRCSRISNVGNRTPKPVNPVRLAICCRPRTCAVENPFPLDTDIQSISRRFGPVCACEYALADTVDKLPASARATGIAARSNIMNTTAPRAICLAVVSTGER